MNIPLLDLKAQYIEIENQCLAVTKKVYESQRFILGPYVEKLEKDIAKLCKTKYAVGVSSGTDALLISLMASGIGPGDIVITTPYTFFSTAGSICRVGATPLFADIDEYSFNIDPNEIIKEIDKLSIFDRRRVKAIIPVHLFGQCANMVPILEIAEQYNLIVIEDAAQAIGAIYENEYMAGSMGDFGCFSFFPSKNLGGFGDGGMVVTNSEENYEKLKCLRVHGSKEKYNNIMIGGNFRLDEIQAAILGVKLKHLERWTIIREDNAYEYAIGFAKLSMMVKNKITLPCFDMYTTKHIYNQYVLKVENRDNLLKFLKEKDIGCAVYYPRPLHLLDCFKDLGYVLGDFQVAERMALDTIALPIGYKLKEEEINYIIKTFEQFYGE